MKIFRILWLCLLMTGLSLSAQNYRIEEILGYKMVSDGLIDNQSEVTGYYIFYRQKVKRGETYTHLLKILDANFTLTADIKVSGSQHVHVLDVVFNGDFLMGEFYDPADKQVLLRMYDRSADEVAVHRIDHSDMIPSNESVGLKSFRGGYYIYNVLVSVPGRGFLYHAPTFNRHAGEGKVRLSKPPTEARNYVCGNDGSMRIQKNLDQFTNPYLTSSVPMALQDQFLVERIYRKNGLKGKASNAYRSIVLSDLQQNKTVFAYDYWEERAKSSTKLEPKVAFVDQAKAVDILGLSKIDEPKEPTYIYGIYLTRLDSAGTQVYEKNLPYTTLFPTEEKDINFTNPTEVRVKDTAYYLHSLHKLSDGNFYLIFEEEYLGQTGKAFLKGQKYAYSTDLIRIMVLQLSPAFEVIQTFKTDIIWTGWGGPLTEAVLFDYVSSLQLMSRVPGNRDFIDLGLKSFRKEEESAYQYQCFRFSPEGFEEDVIYLGDEYQSITKYELFPAKSEHIFMVQTDRKSGLKEFRLEKANF